jgi:hypothetical protein
MQVGGAWQRSRRQGAVFAGKPEVQRAARAASGPWTAGWSKRDRPVLIASDHVLSACSYPRGLVPKARMLDTTMQRHGLVLRGLTVFCVMPLPLQRAKIALPPSRSLTPWCCRRGRCWVAVHSAGCRWLQVRRAVSMYGIPEMRSATSSADFEQLWFRRRPNRTHDDAVRY